MLLGEGDEGVGFGDGEGQRLFDEHVDAALHQLAGGLQVRDGGHGDAGGADAGTGGEHLADGGEGLAAELGCHGLGAREVGVHDGRQLDTFAGQFLVHPGMVAAKRAHADHGYLHCLVIHTLIFADAAAGEKWQSFGDEAAVTNLHPLRIGSGRAGSGCGHAGRESHTMAHTAGAWRERRRSRIRFAMSPGGELAWPPSPKCARLR